MVRDRDRDLETLHVNYVIEECKTQVCFNVQRKTLYCHGDGVVYVHYRPDK